MVTLGWTGCYTLSNEDDDDAADCDDGDQDGGYDHDHFDEEII